MANLVPTPSWDPVYQIEKTDRVLGGPGGTANQQAQNLLNRTEFLEQEKASKSDIVQGQYSFSTLADFEAVKDTIPNNSTVIIDEAGPNQGTNTWDGSILIKSPYDPVEQSKEFTIEKFDSALAAPILRDPNLIPLVVDPSGNVALWLDQGALSFSGLSEDSITKIKNIFSNTFDQLNIRSNILIPLTSDQDGNVALWLDQGKLGANGISDDLFQQIKTNLDMYFVSKNSVPSFGGLTPYSDGKSLNLYRSKKALMQNTNSGQVKVLLDGDSWFQLNPIPDAIFSKLTSTYGESGVGWLSVVPTSSSLIGVNFTAYNNFTLKDYAQPVLQPAPTQGCGIDGLAVESSRTDSLITVSLRTENFRIFYWDGNGTFRYRVDGGSWTTVAGTGSNTKSNVLVSGLSDSNHTFDIDTSGNSGLVTLHGFYATRSAKGAEVSRCGNGDQSGRDASIFSDQIPYFANIIDPDLVIILLGTNEVRFNRSIASYVQGVSDKVQAYRSVNPNVGIILAFPAQCGSDTEGTEQLYRDAGLKFCIENGCEWFSAFDLFGDYELENELGMWSDPNHLNTSGALNLTTPLFKNFLGD